MSVARLAVLWAALILLSCMPAFAQEDAQEEDEPSEDQYAPADAGNGAPGPDSECPGAEVVSTTNSAGSTQTAPFAIAGERFRVNIVLTSASDPQNVFVDVTVQEAQNDDFVTTISQDGNGKKSSLVNAGPGQFYLDILGSVGDEYAITVEDCVDTEGNPPTNDPGDPGDPDDVVPGTGNDKPLPNTGGVPLIFGAAALALAAALLSHRILAP